MSFSLNEWENFVVENFTRESTKALETRRNKRLIKLFRMSNESFSLSFIDFRLANNIFRQVP